jgi:hypothetical protein
MVRYRGTDTGGQTKRNPSRRVVMQCRVLHSLGYFSSVPDRSIASVSLSGRPQKSGELGNLVNRRAVFSESAQYEVYVPSGPQVFKAVDGPTGSIHLAV